MVPEMTVNVKENFAECQTSLEMAPFLAQLRLLPLGWKRLARGSACATPPAIVLREFTVPTAK
jgi:hypothetical protein